MNRPIHFAILGLGMIARHMADALRFSPDVIPYACAASDEKRAQRFAEEFGFQKYYGSYEAMLADPDVDLVYVAVPHSLHCQCAMLCLDHGKNVLVEKPFAANLQQAERMISRAKEKNLFCAEGLWMRYVPVCREVRKAIEDGMIGEPGLVTGEIGYHLTQKRLYDPNLAGGALLDVGIYTAALADLVFPGRRIVKCTADSLLTDRGVDESTCYTFRYEDGKMASMHVSMKYMSSGRGTVWGSEGFIDIDNTNAMRHARVYNREKQEIAHFASPETDNSYVFELSAIVRAFYEGRKDTPECPHEEILTRMANMDEIRRQIGLIYPFEA